jgi:hypothetical protein
VPVADERINGLWRRPDRGGSLYLEIVRLARREGKQPCNENNDHDCNYHQHEQSSHVIEISDRKPRTAALTWPGTRRKRVTGRSTGSKTR